MSKGYLLVASHPPFWVGSWVQHQNPRLTLHTLTHAVLDQRVLTGRMSALVAAKLFTHVRKRRIVEAVRAERETLQNVRWKHYIELQNSWFRTLHVEVLQLGYKHHYNLLCSKSLFCIFVVLSANSITLWMKFFFSNLHQLTDPSTQLYSKTSVKWRDFSWVFIASFKTLFKQNSCCIIAFIGWWMYLLVLIKCARMQKVCKKIHAHVNKNTYETQASICIFPSWFSQQKNGFYYHIL